MRDYVCGAVLDEKKVKIENNFEGKTYFTVYSVR